MLVTEKQVATMNALLDRSFDLGESGTALLRNIGENEFATAYEAVFVALHDDALAAHARVVDAARADDVMLFRATARELTPKMIALRDHLATASDMAKIAQRNR